MTQNEEKIFIEAYTSHFDKGNKYKQEGQYEEAIEEFQAARDIMLALSENSLGSARTRRLNIARSMDTKIEEIKELQKSKVKPSPKKVKKDDDEETLSKVTIEEKEKTIEELLKELDSLEGLGTVKNQVQRLINQVKVFKMRTEYGLPNPDGIAYHMVFLGNPGTGKTTVARLIGGMYHSLDILPTSNFIETDRSGLVAPYMGQTAIKTNEVLEKAKGGVLFIDEAYALKQGHHDDFGQEAIDALTKGLEDYRSELVVIVAGYEEEMKQFINSNPGLKSRFKTFINFEDYSKNELYNIFMGLAKTYQFNLTLGARKKLKEVIENNEFSANARDIRNLFQDVVMNQSSRVVRLDKPSKEDLMTIIEGDIGEENNYGKIIK